MSRGVRSRTKPEAAASGAGGRLVSPALVGRAAELDLLTAAAAAPPAVVVVVVVLLEGEAGIGKTRLVTELASQPRSRGHRIVVGRCRSIREPFPLAPVVEAVRSVAEALADPRLSPVTGALRPLLPELAGLLPPSPEPLDDRVAERHRVFRALVVVLRAIGPAVVVLEDLHWSDEHTLEFLRYAFGDPPDSLSWVLTFRGEEAGPQVPALAARLPTRPTRLALRPLDAGQTGELAARLVARDQVPDEFARHLCERTGGLPFAIEEVVALLRERGLMGTDGVCWPGAAAELSVPAAVRDHVRERVGQLPAQSRPLLEVLAVLQQPASERRVAAVSGRCPDQVAAGLSRAIESGLLVEEGGAVGFRHVLACQAIYEQIPGPRRRALHARAAAALAGERAQLLGQVVHHLRHAGRLDAWAVAAEQAAAQAIALGHDDEASGYWPTCSARRRPAGCTSPTRTPAGSASHWGGRPAGRWRSATSPSCSPAGWSGSLPRRSGPSCRSCWAHSTTGPISGRPGPGRCSAARWRTPPGAPTCGAVALIRWPAGLSRNHASACP